ncbi:COG4705 family protein [Streptomyces sp. NPDC055722]
MCTTVGESFADRIDMNLGVRLISTALIFTAVLAGVLGWQLRTKRYIPFVYWLTVVVVSVTGTLYTDILTDSQGVPLALSASVFAGVLAVVFGIWYARERTLSVHSIITRPRELFYWLAVLVTFALGTATGDWTLALTGWTAGVSVLLPLGLIFAIVVAWRLGANAVLSFWLAYILTRPLGANLGDWLGSPSSEGGLGLGTAATSVIFLVAILTTVVYLTFNRSDVIETSDPTPRAVNPARERIMLGYYAVVAVATAALLVWAHQQPHAAAAGENDTPARPSHPEAGNVTVSSSRDRKVPHDRSRHPGEAQLGRSDGRDHPGDRPRDRMGRRPAHPRAQGRQAWHFLDSEIDHVLTALRAPSPDETTEVKALNALLISLS